MIKTSRAIIRIMLFVALTGSVSCESMLGDMGSDIASLKQRMLLLFDFKPLPAISVKYNGIPVGTGELVDMGMTLEDAPKSITFTVKNTGTPGSPDVNIADITTSGRYAGLFTITPGWDATLVPGEETTFTVTFQLPLAEDGYRAAVVSINTGEDYAPYNLTVACESTDIMQAEIQVWRGVNTRLYDENHYDMLSTTSCTFTIRNVGTAPLSGINISLAGDSEFTLPLPDPADIAPDGRADFTVKFDPLNTDPCSTRLTITYHDGQGPMEFNLDISAQADIILVPEIELHDAGGLLAPPYSHTFSDQLLDTQSPPKEYYIHNTGTGDLVVYGITLDTAGDPDQFVLLAPLGTTTIRSGGILAFTVKYYPREQGNHTATVLIDHDDSDTEPLLLDDDPLEITLSGKTDIGQMQLYEVVDTPLARGVTYDFGGQEVYTVSPDHTFTIKNIDDGILTISSITLSDAGNPNFSLSSISPVLPHQLAKNETMTFVLNYCPQTVSTHTASIVISSNDPAGSFTLNLTGHANLPGIQVYRVEGSPLARNSFYSFGAQDILTESPPHTFTIKNLGDGLLRIYSITVTDTEGAIDFPAPSISETLPKSLEKNGTMTFDLTYSPKTPGTHTASVTIASNDPGGPFVLFLSGNAELPNIVVESPITGDNYMDMGADGDYATTLCGKQRSQPRTYTIRNTGNAPLHISSITLSGTNPDNFDLDITGTSMTINENASTTFTVWFDPTSTGQKYAKIQITCIESDAQPVQNINIMGRGVTPRIKFYMSYLKRIYCEYAGDEESNSNLELAWILTASGANNPGGVDLGSLPPNNWHTIDTGDVWNTGYGSMAEFLLEKNSSTTITWQIYITDIDDDDGIDYDCLACNPDANTTIRYEYLYINYNQTYNRMQWAQPVSYDGDSIAPTNVTLQDLWTEIEFYAWRSGEGTVHFYFNFKAIDWVESDYNP